MQFDPFQMAALGQNECDPRLFNCCKVSLQWTDQLLFHGKQFFKSLVVFFFFGGGGISILLNFLLLLEKNIVFKLY